MHFKFATIACAAAALSLGSQAATVLPAAVVPDATFNWSTGADGSYLTSDDFNNQWGQIGLTRGGSAEVTADYPHIGNGSLKLAANGGVNAKAGVAYYPNSREGFGPLSSITEASFDYMRAEGADTDSTPIMRIFVFEPGTDTHVETLLWTPALNGLTVTTGAWASANVSNGVVSAMRNQLPYEGPFSGLATDDRYKDLVVRAVEIGFGSGGWSGAFVGAADNVVFSGSAASLESNFEALPQQFPVTIEVGANGTTTPATGVQTVNEGETLTIQVIPDAGYEVDTVSGCGGTLSGTAFTTAPITAECSVNASFKAITAPPATAATPVPTLSQWGVAAMALLITGFAALRVARRD
ncbi:IPTL-CTERM sorting domain-containing protein [Comamonas sp.]|uniref:IPTL-CTERM sorting domain-containing protein n=1 Tax=Comamonas sp. TaxID=34028 RepID=UPI0028A7DE68|nr:IPTL-CTERM sorting domain-containing protein [Comamonas sp.]